MLNKNGNIFVMMLQRTYSRYIKEVLETSFVIIGVIIKSSEEIMNNIKCPHCGTVFTINETEYSQLLAQVRSSEFDKEIHERLEKEKALLEEKSKNDLQVQASAKDKEIADLTTQLEQLKQSLELDNQRQLAKKDQEILKLKSSLKISNQIKIWN